MAGHSGSLEHLLAELERIDLLIQAAVGRARRVAGDIDEFRGFYISEQEVDRLLDQPAGLPAWAVLGGLTAEPATVEALVALASRNAARAPADSRLLRLARACALTPLDVDVLLIALAPDLDLRYQRLFAYLQDDVTRRRPSVDLILNLLSPSFAAKVTGRQRLAPGAPLLAHQLVSVFEDPNQPAPALLERYVRVDDRVAAYLLDSDALDARLLPYATLVTPQAQLDDLLMPAEDRARLEALTRAALQGQGRFVLYLQGPYGVGKQTAADALACRLNLPLLRIDGAALAGAADLSFTNSARLVAREALLQGAAIYWSGFDALLGEERAGYVEVLLDALANYPGLAFLAGGEAWEPADLPPNVSFLRVELPYPGYRERVRLWQRSLDGSAPPEAALLSLAGKFHLTGGQIRDAAGTARGLARWRDPAGGRPTLAELEAASRLQSSRKLSTLARHITPHYAWDDIVLLADRKQQLREICNYVKYRAQVYEVWGFEGKLALGRGLNALFAGPSGTGKTMAADIIACELGLELYKIDLANVVSKYIGETEKNLSRIFDEAQDSNAILFFDEADALFGKRSEVRDSHDRYANIEIGYLLQKMEEYEGVVILATNLRKNMDDAFVRRLHFAVEFPFPGEADRRRIWAQIWPRDTPLHPDLDLDFMARRFEITGGNIRNIALAAAFLAADGGGPVDMSHLVRATQREYQKMGKVAIEGEFGPYAASLRRDN